MTNNPRFLLELRITDTGDVVKVDDPTIIDDQLVQTTWNMIGYFVEGTLRDLGLEANEPRLRELIIECCYKLILREMTTLRNLPVHDYPLTKTKPKSRRARRKDRQEAGDAVTITAIRCPQCSEMLQVAHAEGHACWLKE